MLNQFYGIKLLQSQTFTAEGVRIPVTEILAEPLTVVQVKTFAKDGYVALKVAFGHRKEKNIKKPVLGILKKVFNPSHSVIPAQAGIQSQEKAANLDPRLRGDEQERGEDDQNSKQSNVETQHAVSHDEGQKTMFPRYIREIRIKNNEAIENIKAGDKITIADIFKEGDVLHVSGIGIGKGFAGVVKRHGFAGGPRTHGQSDRERAPGSIGQTTTPGRVYKGKRMAGRMGGEQVTIKNLKVVRLDATRNVVIVKGLVPGKRKGVLKLYK